MELPKEARGRNVYRQSKQKPFGMRIPSNVHSDGGVDNCYKGRKAARDKFIMLWLWTVPVLAILIIAWFVYGVVSQGRTDMRGFSGEREGGPVASLSAVETGRRADDGLMLLDIDTMEAVAYMQVDKPGVYVLSVAEGSQARLAGLKPGDCILELNGEPVTDSTQLLITLSSMTSGEEADFVVMRGAARINLTIFAQDESEL